MLMKTFKKIIPFFILFLISCSSNNDDTTPIPLDPKLFFIGNWHGQQQIDGVSNPYAFDLIINANNTVLNIDLAFNSTHFPGSYSYTKDSLKINYDNGTKWKLKFSSNYTSCSGTVLGYEGATGTVTMSKN